MDQNQAGEVENNFLYVGNQITALNKEFLAEYEITDLINAGFPKLRSHFSNENSFNYLDLEIYETPNQDFISILEKAVKFIEEARFRHRRVLVYCITGNNKSVAVVTGYLMLKHLFNLREAFERVAPVRPSADMKDWALDLLVQLEIAIQRLKQQKMQKKSFDLKFSKEEKEEGEDEEVSLKVEQDLQREFESGQWKNVLQIAFENSSNSFHQLLRKLLFRNIKNFFMKLCEQSPNKDMKYVDQVWKEYLVWKKKVEELPRSQSYLRLIEISLPFAFDGCGPELAKNMAEHIHSLLQPNAPPLAEDIDQDEQLRITELKKIIFLSTFLKEKMLFETIFMNQLAKRLLASSPPRLELEDLVLQKFKENKSNKFVFHGENMIRDYKLSSTDLNENFARFEELQPVHGTPLKVFCAEGANWPFEPFLPKADPHRFWLGINCNELPPKPILPSPVGKAYFNFEQFWSATCPGKTAFLQPQLGVASMQLDWRGRTFFINCSTYVMIVLELFSVLDSFTFQEFYDQTKIDPLDLAETLLYLSQPHDECPIPMLIHHPVSKAEQTQKVHISVKDSWTFNPNFNSKSTKISLFPK